MSLRNEESFNFWKFKKVEPFGKIYRLDYFSVN